MNDRNEDNYKIQIGKKIRKYRLARGYSRLKLGAKVGISDSQILKYETGRDHVRASTLLMISDALNVPIILFVGSMVESEYEAEAADNLTTPGDDEIFAAFRRIAPSEVRARVARLILALAGQGNERQDGAEP